MQGLCKCKMFLIPGDVMIASEQQFRGVEMNMGSYSFNNALLMRLDGRRGCGVRGWLFCSWQRPWGLLAGVFSWQNERRRHNEDRPSHPALSRLLCHFSQRPQLYSAVFHKGSCCCRALSCIVWRTKRKKEDNARWNSARAFVCIFLFLRVLLCCALAGKMHLEGRSDLFRVRGSSSCWKPIITCNLSFYCESYDVKHMKRFMPQTKYR